MVRLTRGNMNDKWQLEWLDDWDRRGRICMIKDLETQWEEPVCQIFFLPILPLIKEAQTTQPSPALIINLSPVTTLDSKIAWC